ncbi:MAG TPA: HD domain-containing protein [Anaerolineales bacterium]|nr:HD domain-containing protein [Anaerolineales bacterium]
MKVSTPILKRKSSFLARRLCTSPGSRMEEVVDFGQGALLWVLVLLLLAGALALAFGIRWWRVRRYLRAYQALVDWLPAAVQAEDKKALVEAAADAIARHLFPGFPAHHVGILLYNPQRGALEVVAHRGKHPPSQDFLPVDEGIMGRAWHTGQPQRVADVHRDPDYFPVHPDTRAELDVPIPGAEGLLGVIGVESPRRRAFDAQDEFFLSTLARFLGLALEHLTTREALARRLAMRERLSRFYAALRKAQRLEEIATRFGQEVLALSQAVAGAVFLAAEGEGGQTARALFFAPASQGPPPAIPPSAWEDLPTGLWSLSPGETLPETVQALGPAWQRVRMLWVEPLPLSHGLALFGWEQPQQLPLWVWEILPLVGQAVDGALVREALVRRLRSQVRHLRNLRAVDQAMTSRWLGLGRARDQVLRVLLRRLRHAFHLPGAAIWGASLEGDAAEQFVCLAFDGRVPEAVRSVAISRARLVSMQASEAFSPFVIYDIDEQADLLPASLYQALRDSGLRAFAAFRLMAHGRLMGQLEIFHTQPFPKRREWWTNLSAYAYQAAIVLEQTATWRALERTNRELKAALDGALHAWARTVGLRSQATRGHSKRVAALTVSLGRTLGFKGEDLAALRWGALLHDLGKVGVPDAVLFKPGPLTEEEFALVRQHSVWGDEIVGEIPHISPIVRHMVRYHHERWDGSGYPDGLRGEDIPLEARVLAVVDVWDALTSDRPYRPAYPHYAALIYLRENAGVLFDPRVVRQFLRLVSPDENHNAAY